MIIFIVKIYCIGYVSICLHELSHCLLGYFIYGQWNTVVIGNKTLSIHIGHWYFSPLPYTGYNEYDRELLLRSKKKLGIVFYLSGILSNVLLSVLILLIGSYSGELLYTAFAFGMNISLAVLNCIPLFGSDIEELVKYIHDFGYIKHET